MARLLGMGTPIGCTHPTTHLPTRKGGRRGLVRTCCRPSRGSRLACRNEYRFEVVPDDRAASRRRILRYLTAHRVGPASEWWTVGVLDAGGPPKGMTTVRSCR